MGTPVLYIRLLITIETIYIAFISLMLSILFSVIISFAINTSGGIIFPPPPGSSNELHLGASLSMQKTLQTGVVIIIGAIVSGIVCTFYIGKRSILTFLEIRN
jgi:ABC-type antimicrobial peptide transport system permease subunit